MNATRVCVYVDGFNLYHGMHEKFGRRYLWLDLEALARSFLRPGDELKRVAYFTARVRNDPKGQANQAVYLGALRAGGAVEVVEGRFQEKTVTCRGCQKAHISYEEKESDVNLAASLVEDAAVALFDRAILVSADSDFAPAVRSAKRLLADARIVVACPPARNSNELRRTADSSFFLGANKLRHAQFPETVTGMNSVNYTRPPRWS